MSAISISGCPPRTLPERITDKYIGIMFLIFPLFTGFHGYGAITLSKFLFFVIVTCIWLAALVIAFLFCRKSPTCGGIHPSAAQFAVVVFLLICVVSALVSPYGVQTLLGAGRYDGLLTLLLYGAVFLGISATGIPRKIYVFLLGISSFICCVIAVLQLSGLDPLWLFPNDLNYYDAHISYTGEFLGTIGNTNLLSGFLTLCIPLFAGIYICCGEKWDSLLLIPAALGTFILISSGVSGGAVALTALALLIPPILLRDLQRVRRALLTSALLCVSVSLALAVQFQEDSVEFSPGLASFALLAAAVLCLLLIVWSLRIRRSISPSRLSKTFAVCSVCIVLFGLTLIYFWPGDCGTVYELSCVLHGEIHDQFGSSRILIWRDVLALVPERLLFGGGPDTLALRLDLTFSRFVPETGVTLHTFVDNAHNEYLGYLVNVGLLGLMAYLAAMVCSIVTWLRHRDVASILPALGCGILCYWIQGLFGLGLCIVAPVLWILWGLLESRDHNFADNSRRSL